MLMCVKKPVSPGMKMFFFRLHTSTLLVGTWMHKKMDIYGAGEHGLLCEKPENIEQDFSNCWGGVFFWNVLQLTLKKDLE